MEMADSLRSGGRARRPHPALRLAGVVLALTLVPAFARAQQADPGWVGKRVVAKYPHFTLESEKRAGQVLGALDTYRVDQVDGARLRITSEFSGRTGWTPADQVVPLENAIAFFSDYIRANPRDASGYLLRANVWFKEKDLSAALTDLDEAIRIDPTRAGLYSTRGAVWYRRGDYDKAIADFSEAIHLAPRQPGNYYNRAQAWDRKHEYDKAIADFQSALRLLPNFAQAYDERAVTRMHRREYDRALADLNKAIRIDPKLASAYSNRARLWASCPNARYRSGKKAVESATMACKLTVWKNAENITVLAAAYAEAGDFASAVKWQTKSNELAVGADVIKQGEDLLKLYRAKKPYHEPAS